MSSQPCSRRSRAHAETSDTAASHRRVERSPEAPRDLYSPSEMLACRVTIKTYVANIPDTFRFWVLRASKRAVPECLKNLHVTFRTLSVLIVLRHPAPLEVRKARSRYAHTRPVCKPSRAFNSRIGGCAGPPGARSLKSRNWLRVAVAGAARHEGSNPRCHIHLGTPIRAGKVSGCAACRP